MSLFSQSITWRTSKCIFERILKFVLQHTTMKLLFLRSSRRRRRWRKRKRRLFCGLGSHVDSPLGAVGVARVALVVGLSVLEDEAAGTLQAVRTLLHAVGAIFEVEALYAVLGALQIGRKKTPGFFFNLSDMEGGCLQMVCPHTINSTSAISKALNCRLLWRLF